MARGTGGSAWTHRQVITCEGGPYEGQWFFIEDWEKRLRAAQRMADLVPGKQVTATAYQRTTRVADHPIEHVTGAVWEHPARRGSLPRPPRR